MLHEAVERRLTGTYHLSGATPISRYDLTLNIARAFNLDESLITPVTSEKLHWTARRPADSSLDVSKASITLKNKPIQIDHALSILRDALVKGR